MNHHRDSTDELRSIIADALTGAAQALRQQQPRLQAGVDRAEVNNPAPEPDLFNGRLTLKADEAAEVLGIGRTKLYQLIYAGELPSFTVGRRRLISTSALREWVETRSHSSG